MTAYIAFLRGINVGAHNRMKMAELRELCESLGHENIQTYIASGNVVFETAETDTRALSTELADATADSFDYDITVMIRTRTELDDIIEYQPFDEPADDTVKRYVTFLNEEPADEQIDALSSAETAAESFVVHSREVYSRIDTEKMDNGRFTDVGKILKMPATRRTWNVVTNVQALTD
jgi:uncharacterized protein (DUF1697 family)